jgi:hypothetical protein
MADSHETITLLASLQLKRSNNAEGRGKSQIEAITLKLHILEGRRQILVLLPPFFRQRIESAMIAAQLLQSKKGESIDSPF